jgi:hypothetical protein
MAALVRRLAFVGFVMLVVAALGLLPAQPVRAASTTTTLGDHSAPFSASAQSVTFQVAVNSPAGTVNEGTVTFTVLQGATQIGSAVTSGTVSGGNVGATYTVPGGTAVGVYTINAVYSDGADFDGSATTATLTINGPGPRSFVVTTTQDNVTDANCAVASCTRTIPLRATTTRSRSRAG